MSPWNIVLPPYFAHKAASSSTSFVKEHPIHMSVKGVKQQLNRYGWNQNCRITFFTPNFSHCNLRERNHLLAHDTPQNYIRTAPMRDRSRLPLIRHKMLIWKEMPMLREIYMLWQLVINYTLDLSTFMSWSSTITSLTGKIVDEGIGPLYGCLLQSEIPLREWHSSE